MAHKEKWHNNSLIWLQDNEEEGTADCGCRLINDESGARFIMCTKHKAAPELLEALRGVRFVINADPTLHYLKNEPWWNKVQKAIAKALGKE